MTNPCLRTITIIRKLDGEGLLIEQAFADGVEITNRWYVPLDPGYSRFVHEYARAAYHFLPGPHKLVLFDYLADKVTVLEERLT